MTRTYDEYTGPDGRQRLEGLLSNFNRERGVLEAALISDQEFDLDLTQHQARLAAVLEDIAAVEAALGRLV